MNSKEFALTYHAETLQLIKDLCTIPAPSHKEELRAAFCKAWFEKAGFENVTIDEALNVICPVNVTEDNELVVFMAHTDTVFPDLEPMPFIEDGETWRCPGIGDDTANLAAMMITARQMLKEGSCGELGYLFVANSCEEGLGNLKGCRQLMADYGSRVKEVISFDGGLGGIMNKAVGSHRYRIAVSTEGGHSYGAFGNRNAIHQLSALINALYSVKVPKNGNSKTTYNVGAISGGTSVNTIAQYAEMLYEYRSDDRECLEQMRVMLMKMLEAFAATGIEVEWELLGERPCMGEVDPEKQAALEARARKALEPVVGPVPGGRSGSTDCNIPFSMGIPAVCFGAYRGGGAHTREEFILPESLKDGLDVLYRFIGGYFGL